MPFLQQPGGGITDSSGLIQQHVAPQSTNFAMNGTLYNPSGEIIGQVPNSPGDVVKRQRQKRLAQQAAQQQPMALPPAPVGGGVQGGTGGGAMPPPPTPQAAPQPPTIPPITGQPPIDIQPGGGDPAVAQSPWSPMGAQPGQYDQVSQFSDEAYNQARRHLDPLQAQQNRRFDQELINRGIDPFSEAGKQMADQLARQQNDQNMQASYGALQFGQGIQNQMFGQSMAMNNLELARQKQEFGELMGYANFDRQGQQYQDQLTMALMGMMPMPGQMAVDPTGFAATQMASSAGGGLLTGM
jgi:hypothetical protein